MMLRPKLILYVDVVSPFAYLAFYILNVGLASCTRQIHLGKPIVSFFILFVKKHFEFSIMMVSLYSFIDAHNWWSCE